MHNRGDLSAAQRAASAAEVATLENGTNRYSKKVGLSTDRATAITVAEAAKMFNVSIPSVNRAKKRMREDPEAHAAIKAGLKPPKKAKTAPSAEEQAAASLKIQQMAIERGISWAYKGDEISAAVRKATGKKLLRAVDVSDPQTASVVEGVLDDIAGRTLEEQYKSHRAEVATLHETAQQKLERLVNRELKIRLAMFDQEVREKAREQLPEQVKVLREAEERAHAEFKKYAAMAKGIKAQISEDDYRFLLNVLHPDRAPEDRRDKFAKAFDIVRKLDGYIKACKS
jgi:transposase